ncbi:General transcription factor II-I repeat domain-containing protein 2B [Trachymyrmex zeteki]|uniref:General transcription factor II-I repeat domain-containing protein 2B n=1 Tax=Mycetomoellerius zeteki TaxID=64791 RepID=A0A151X665_9HYME|nr:PREDICTED: general transcription factor II-I repeat domain-containing protein 2B-like [Trachymyrmex zeteki]KYQ55832.1 General transcription factor II-I repeat domain-containing protein 2B [Trachymyrmex zeteki]
MNRYVQSFDKVWEEIFFVSINNKTTCLLCGYQPSVVKKYVLHRHYNIKHSNEYSTKYMGQEKHDLIQGLKLVYQEGSIYDIEGCSSSSDTTSSIKALTASYAISNLIGKHSKPFTEGKFVKECIVAAVQSFGDLLTLQEAASIPLSAKAVKSRINDIALCLEEKLKSLLQSCSFFSLCFDESTDNRHMSQLSIFVRIVQNDFSYVEELLDFVPLHKTTTGVDIFKAVNQTLEKFDTDFSRCSAIVTDGAKAMTGSKIGFVGQIKQRDLKFPIIHCIIHQEALCGKVVKLCSAMQTVTKIINMIKGGHKFLSHRKFQQFLEEHNAVYTDVPLYCDVRWLSAGKCLETFFTIRKEIFLFLQDNFDVKYDEFKSFFQDLDSVCELALLTDLTNHLNNLNLKLQKTDQTISQLVSHIDSFKRKLKLFKNQIENNIFHFYPSCQIIFEEHGTNCNFQKHLFLIESLINQFDKRFKDFDILRKDLILFENPLTAQIEEQSPDLQIELCDLQCDLSLKNRSEKGVNFFKILNASDYPSLRNCGLRIFSMFGSTYLCECSFSKMKLIKNDKRSSLSDASLSSLMRITSFKISVDVPSLVESCKRPRKSN